MPPDTLGLSAAGSAPEAACRCSLPQPRSCTRQTQNTPSPPAAEHLRQDASRRWPGRRQRAARPAQHPSQLPNEPPRTFMHLRRQGDKRGGFRGMYREGPAQRRNGSPGARWRTPGGPRALAARHAAPGTAASRRHDRRGKEHSPQPAEGGSGSAGRGSEHEGLRGRPGALLGSPTVMLGAVGGPASAQAITQAQRESDGAPPA